MSLNPIKRNELYFNKYVFQYIHFFLNCQVPTLKLAISYKLNSLDQNDLLKNIINIWSAPDIEPTNLNLWSTSTNKNIIKEHKDIEISRIKHILE